MVFKPAIVFLALFSLARGQAGPPYTKAIVVAGRDSAENLASVEGLSLEGSGANCPDQLPPYPFEVRFMVGAFLPDLNESVVCGGDSTPIGEDGPIDATGLCFSYSRRTGAWAPFSSLSERRTEAASSTFPDNTWLVTGGRDQNNDALSSTEFYSADNGVFLPGPALPFTMRGHCQVTIDANTAFLGGGSITESGDWNRAFLFNKDTGEFTELPNMPDEMEYPSCGLAMKSNGNVDVVMTGESTTYLLDTVTREWRVAASDFVDNDLYASTVYQGTDTVYLIGGYTGEYINTVHRYIPDEERWEQLPTTLSVNRRSPVAIAVPDDQLQC